MPQSKGDGLATTPSHVYAQSMYHCALCINYHINNHNRNRVLLYNLFQENKSFGSKKPFAFILWCTGSCVKHTSRPATALAPLLLPVCELGRAGSLATCGARVCWAMSHAPTHVCSIYARAWSLQQLGSSTHMFFLLICKFFVTLLISGLAIAERICICRH
jgi:hypothetical protein